MPHFSHPVLIFWCNDCQAKDWAKADEIRDAIKAQGYVIKDVKGGASSLIKA